MLDASFAGFNFTDKEIRGIRASRADWRSERGERMGLRSTVVLSGTVRVDETQPNYRQRLNQRMRQLENAADAANGSLVIRANGINTSHSMSLSDAFGGFRANLTWQPNVTPYGMVPELDIIRSFALTVEADILDDGSANPIVSWREMVTVIGTGGPRRRVRTSLRGQPRRSQLAAMTAVRVVQTGSAVGLTANVDAPPPIFLGDELDEEGHQVGYGGATAVVNGTPRNFPTSWNYRFELTGSAGRLAGGNGP